MSNTRIYKIVFGCGCTQFIGEKDLTVSKDKKTVETSRWKAAQQKDGSYVTGKKIQCVRCLTSVPTVTVSKDGKVVNVREGATQSQVQKAMMAIAMAGMLDAVSPPRRRRR